MALREDKSRVRDDPARENLAVLRHIGLNRLKNDDTKLGIQYKRLPAGVGRKLLGSAACRTAQPAQETPCISYHEN